MTQIQFGPTNITYGNSAFFTAEFFDSNGFTTVPAGATLAISYLNILNNSQTDSLVMTQFNSFFNTTWSSTNAAMGLASWTITVTGFSTASQLGQIRVIDP